MFCSFSWVLFLFHFDINVLMGSKWNDLLVICSCCQATGFVQLTVFDSKWKFERKRKTISRSRRFEVRMISAHRTCTNNILNINIYFIILYTFKYIYQINDIKETINKQKKIKWNKLTHNNLGFRMGSWNMCQSLHLNFSNEFFFGFFFARILTGLTGINC